MPKAASALLTSSALLLSVGASAYDDERAKSNFAHELVECAAYFAIAAEGIQRAGNTENATALQTLSDALLEGARKYSREETVLARYQLAMEEQVLLIHGDYANLSVLIAKYKEVCKQASEEPESRLEYWRKKI